MTFYVGYCVIKYPYILGGWIFTEQFCINICRNPSQYLKSGTYSELGVGSRGMFEVSVSLR